MARNLNPSKIAAREAAQRRRHPSDAGCARCGECRLPALIEQHHPAGRNHDRAYTAPLCRNCHAVETDDQIREGVPLSAQPSVLERHVARDRALAASKRSEAKSEERAANELEALLKSEPLSARRSTLERHVARHRWLAASKRSEAKSEDRAADELEALLESDEGDK